MSLDPQRRASLLATKLTALVRDHRGEGGVAPGVFAGGAGVLAGDAAWVLCEDEPARSLGAALAWVRQQGAASLNVLAESGTGQLARRAEQFDPAPAVWRVEGRSIVPAVPEPLTPPAPVHPAALELVPVIVAGGAEPIVEHGVLTGEVVGLEVCRVEVDEAGIARLEVGVGPHDREAFALMHGHLPPAESLTGVVEAVAPHRRFGAPAHALARLVPERALRHLLVAEPERVGAAELVVAQPPVPRGGVKERWPAVAHGRDAHGRPMVVVTSTGIDLDLVPFAADARLAAERDARLVLAVPARDDHPVTRALAGSLAVPAEVVAVPGFEIG